MHGRHGIFPYQRLPGLFMMPSLRMGQPGLDVLAGRTRLIAGWQEIDINGTAAAPGAGALAMLQQIGGLSKVFVSSLGHDVVKS
jgi:hypothetical protein